VASLEAIGRRNGVRLSLRRRDPVFRPLLLALDRLSKLRGALERGDARCVPALRRVAVALNEEGFRDLGRTVRSLATLALDASTLRGLAARVRAEPSLAGVPEVVVHAETSVRVRIFRGDLEDVVCNLLRNALTASRDAGVGAVTLSLTVDVDPVTFLEDAVIRVGDHAPGTLTTARLADQLIERGLGIVVDTVRQVNGTLSVEALAESGLGKALVFRLPVVEQAVLVDGGQLQDGET